MKFSNLTEHEIRTMLHNLLLLVDGNYNYVEDIVEDTGLSKEDAFEVMCSISKLKSIDDL